MTEANSSSQDLPELPISVINYVTRTQEHLVLNEATKAIKFAKDPYIKARQPKSVLCVQIVSQGNLIGLLYLENNLTTGAFTKSRVELLEILTAQAAISLENAQLYQQLEEYSQSLEEKVEERTQELKAAQKQIVAQEKLASLGALTAGIAHELRNPLNFVNNFASISADLLQELKSEIENNSAEEIEELLGDLEENLTDINEQGKRADSIISSMLAHSRQSTARRELTDINALLVDSVNLAYNGLRTHDLTSNFDITIEADYDRAMPQIEVMSQDLSRAFLNIINNACYAANGKKKEVGDSFTPLVTLLTRNLESAVEIRIRDNGNGVPPEIQEKIFHPFFTTKPTGEGTGLGLSLTHDIIVGQHHGELLLETQPGSYAEFIIRLPKPAD